MLDFQSKGENFEKSNPKEALWSEMLHLKIIFFKKTCILKLYFLILSYHTLSNNHDSAP